MTIAPGVRLGAYEITALIGEGGMGPRLSPITLILNWEPPAAK